MATYEELFKLHNDSTLLNRISVAIAVEVDTLRGGTPTADQKWWMKRVMESGPQQMAKDMIWALLAANKAATVANIQAATDVAMQSNVSAAVSIFATIDEGADKNLVVGAGT